MTPPPISHLDASTAAGHSTHDTPTIGRPPRGMTMVRSVHRNGYPPRRQTIWRTEFQTMPAR